MSFNVKPGDMVEARMILADGGHQWFRARVVRITGRSVRIELDGWGCWWTTDPADLRAPTAEGRSQ